MNQSRKTLSKLRICDLRPHEFQLELYGRPSKGLVECVGAADKDDLAPIHVLEDMQVIDGWVRLLARKRAGDKYISGYIRHDLTLATDDEIRAFMIDFNLHRRHLTTIQRAELYWLRMQLPGGEKYRKSGKALEEDVKKMAGITGKTLQRLLPILTGPKEVLAAVKTGILKQVDAYALLTLSQEKQAPLLRKLRNGQSLRRDLALYFAKHRVKADLDDPQLHRKLKNYIDTTFLLERHLVRVAEMVNAPQIPTLLRMREVLTALITAVESRVSRASRPKLRLIRQLSGVPLNESHDSVSCDSD